jgi:hypothetical protein
MFTSLTSYVRDITKEKKQCAQVNAHGYHHCQAVKCRLHRYTRKVVTVAADVIARDIPFLRWGGFCYNFKQNRGIVAEHVLFLQIIALLLSVFGASIYKFADSVKIDCFQLDLSHV